MIRAANHLEHTAPANRRGRMLMCMCGSIMCPSGACRGPMSMEQSA